MFNIFSILTIYNWKIFLGRIVVDKYFETSRKFQICKIHSTTCIERTICCGNGSLHLVGFYNFHFLQLTNIFKLVENFKYLRYIVQLVLNEQPVVETVQHLVGIYNFFYFLQLTNILKLVESHKYVRSILQLALNEQSVVEKVHHLAGFYNLTFLQLTNILKLVESYKHVRGIFQIVSNG